MKWDYRHQLLIQIELLRGEITHQALSKRLGDVTERSLARYIAGKCYLTVDEFHEVSRAVSVDAEVLARRWAKSLSLHPRDKDVVTWMVSRAHLRWREHARIPEQTVPSHPSPMALIRAKYADRLSRRTPPLWFRTYSRHAKRQDTPENRARFARAYEMLVESVHGRLSARDIGALRGISGERARQLMVDAAHTWARREKIDLSGKSASFKNEAGFVRKLYAGLSFFGEQQFNELVAKDLAKKSDVDGGKNP
jgi:hypothetical protein